MNEQQPDNLQIIFEPPYSRESERAIIGGLLMDPKKIEDVLEIIEESDFYTRECRLIFPHIRKLWESRRAVDVITVSESLSAAGEIDQVGGFQSISSLAESSMSSRNIISYAKAVREKSTERALITASMFISEVARDNQYTTEEKVDEAQRIVLAIDTDIADEVPEINDALRKAVEDIDNKYNNKGQTIGTKTGFSAMDDRLMAMEPSDLIILGGRPSMGKTTLAMNIVENIIMDDGAALIFSMEMSSKSLTDRLLSSISGIPFTFIRSGNLREEHWTLLGAAVSKLKDKPLFIDDRPGLSINQMRATARKLNKKKKLSLIVVDYLQLAKEKGENRTNEMTIVSQGLKAIAKELNVPVLALSQLNRECEKGPNKRPANHHLRDSGAIEQDADVIMFLYRDEVYYEDTNQKGIAEVIFTKLRNGVPGTEYLKSTLEVNRFVDLDRPVPPLQENQKDFSYD